MWVDKMEIHLKLGLKKEILIFKNVNNVFIENGTILIEEKLDSKRKKIYPFDLFFVEYWTEEK